MSWSSPAAQYIYVLVIQLHLWFILKTAFSPSNQAMAPIALKILLFTSLIVPSISLSDQARNGHARTICEVKPGGSSEIDDVPAIVDALTTCGSGGRVIFSNNTYHINSVMNTIWLDDVEIDLQGTLLVNKLPRYVILVSCLFLTMDSGAPTSPTGLTTPSPSATRINPLPGSWVAKTLPLKDMDTEHSMEVAKPGINMLDRRRITHGDRTS